MGLIGLGGGTGIRSITPLFESQVLQTALHVATHRGHQERKNIENKTNILVRP